MNKIITNRTITAAAIGAAALFTMMSTGSAQASSLLRCHGATVSKAASCCEHVIEKKGMPFWMMQSGTSCREAVVCHGGGLTIGAKSEKRCYIRVVNIDQRGGNEPEGGKGRGGQSSTQAQ